MHNSEHDFFRISVQPSAFFVSLAIILLNILIVALVVLDQLLPFSPANPIPVLMLGLAEAILIAPFASRLLKAKRLRQAEVKKSAAPEPVI